MIRLTCSGFDLWMHYDPNDELDQEIVRLAADLMVRRQKAESTGQIHSNV